jgi:hypothetical protein
MDADRFWQIIEDARDRASDGEEQAELIYEVLKALSPDEIIAFDKAYDQFPFRAYRWDLWGAAHTMNGGCSDDGFEYFRAWLISRGRSVYEHALDDPDSLADEYDPDRDDYELESLMYAPVRAYEDATGQSMPQRDRMFPDLIGEPWEEEDLNELLPRLTAVSGG